MLCNRITITQKVAEFLTTAGLFQDGEMVAIPQKIVVFQQNNSGENKVKGITRLGGDLFNIEVFAIDQALPLLIDNTGPFLPEDIQGDLVLDFLRHPDLSHDLALICHRRGIPVVASGKKFRVKGALTPPT